MFLYIACVAVVVAFVFGFYVIYRDISRKKTPARVSKLLIFPIKSCAGLVGHNSVMCTKIRDGAHEKPYSKK